MPKVYRFYRKSDIENMDNRLYKDFPVYAITDNKELANKFISTRNMNSFKVMKSKMTKEEYAKYANTTSTSELKEYSFVTRNNNNEWEKVKVVTTWYEREQVRDMVTGQFIELIEIQHSPEIFNRKIIDVLETLQYMQLHAIKKQYYEGEYEDSIPNLSYDELEMLLRYNSDTF